MAKVRDYHKLALDIIDVVGGQKNIVNATRCATRLRLVLKETPEGAKKKYLHWQELSRLWKITDSSRL